FTALAFPVALNTASQVAFSACVSTCSPTENGAFVATPLDTEYCIAQVVMNGDTSPTGGLIESFNLPSLNTAGDMAFTVCAPGCSDTSKHVFVFKSAAGAYDVDVAASSTDPAPSGGTFSLIDNT